MSEKKLKKLLAAARNQNAPAPAVDFAAGVLRAVRREQPVSLPETFSVFDQLNQLFPKLAWAAAAVIALGVAADFALTAAGVPSLDAGASQISAQWLFTGTGL